jgi:hypothetical protein
MPFFMSLRSSLEDEEEGEFQEVEDDDDEAEEPKSCGYINRYVNQMVFSC